MKKIETTNIDLELRLIDKLLSLNLGDQIYDREIRILFKVIETKITPMFITDFSLTELEKHRTQDERRH